MSTLPTSHDVSDFAEFDVASAPIKGSNGERTAEVGPIARVDRMGCSYYGNPYFLVTFASGLRLRTKIDASINYAVENFTSRDAFGKSLTVKVTRSGRIFDFQETQA